MPDDYINCTAQKVAIFGVILVRIFPHSDWIRRDTPNLSVFSPNAGKCFLSLTPLFLVTFPKNLVQIFGRYRSPIVPKSFLRSFCTFCKLWHIYNRKRDFLICILLRFWIQPLKSEFYRLPFFAQCFQLKSIKWIQNFNLFYKAVPNYLAKPSRRCV